MSFIFWWCVVQLIASMLGCIGSWFMAALTDMKRQDVIRFWMHSAFIFGGLCGVALLTLGRVCG